MMTKERRLGGEWRRMARSVIIFEVNSHDPLAPRRRTYCASCCDCTVPLNILRHDKGSPYAFHIANTSVRGIDTVTVIYYLVTLHDAEASNASIRHAERFGDHPTLKRYTTVVQCADTPTEFAIGSISCSLSADALHLERTFDGG
jgi:hypothetical protein